MSNQPESSTGSFIFRFVIFIVFLAIGVAGFSSLAYHRLYGEQIPANVNAAASPTPPADNINRPVSEPYTGDLSIFEDAKREENLQINRVMDILGIKEGSNVADIGAGSGWFTVRAARRAGAKGTVYAGEINQDYIKYINERAAKENLPNIKTVLGKEDNPLLPENSVDAALILKTYHEIAQPVRLMKNLRKSLRQNARVGIIDKNGKGDDHGIAQETVVKEMEQAGYKLLETHDFVKPDGMDYFLVFQAK
jgi:predicted methyltransferase